MWLLMLEWWENCVQLNDKLFILFIEKSNNLSMMKMIQVISGNNVEKQTDRYIASKSMYIMMCVVDYTYIILWPLVECRRGRDIAGMTAQY